jgi:ketosteroid isomerase-like protein
MTTTTDTNTDLAGLARRWWGSVERVDVETMMSLTADDIVLRPSGRSRWAGEYHGKEALLEWWGTLTAAYPNLECQLDDTLVGGQHVAYLVRLTIERDHHRVADNSTWILRVRGGLIVELWIRDGDQYAMDEFFAKFENPNPVE